jgi:hypothetical protein
MINEVDTVNLDHVYLYSELYTFGLLTSYDWTYVTLGDRDTPIWITFTCFKDFPLLG